MQRTIIAAAALLLMQIALAVALNMIWQPKPGCVAGRASFRLCARCRYCP